MLSKLRFSLTMMTTWRISVHAGYGEHRIDGSAARTGIASTGKKMIEASRARRSRGTTVYGDSWIVTVFSQIGAIGWESSPLGLCTTGELAIFLTTFMPFVTRPKIV